MTKATQPFWPILHGSSVGAVRPPSLGTNSTQNVAYTMSSIQFLHSPHTSQQKMSLHPQVQGGQATIYSALSVYPSPPPSPSLMDGPLQVHVLPHKRSSKWNSVMYRRPDLFIVIFNTHGTLAGCGVRHKDFASYSAAIMNSAIVNGGELMHFPTGGAKIQFRIVVRWIQPFHALQYA